MMKLLVSISFWRRQLSVFRNLICLVYQNWNQKKQFLLWFWKGSTGRVANWLWEKPDISCVGSCERNYYEETFVCSCCLSTSTNILYMIK